MVRSAHTLIALAALASWTPASAEGETYLRCNFRFDSGREDEYRLAIYPDRSQVVITPARTGEGTSFPATFTAETVQVISRRHLFSITVSRTNLDAIYVDGAYRETAFGRCEVQETTQNRF